jgi:meiotically up-regulated gene 157 (Mug157) protein
MRCGVESLRFCVANQALSSHLCLFPRLQIDGFGNAYFMDDANIPSLLALPYFGYVQPTDPVYLATRSLVLSQGNPWYFNGTAAAGIGGPHNGPYYIWPMALIAQVSMRVCKRCATK